MTTPILPNMFEKRLINGRQILYRNNQEAYLAGIYPEIQTLDGGSVTSTSANVNFHPQMKRLLANHANNFFKFWMIFYPVLTNPANVGSDCVEKPLSVTAANQPFRDRYCPFLYTDEGKWDLFRFNSEYLLKVKKMIETAREYGIVVQLSLFDRCGTDFVGSDRCRRWPFSPWNAVNNINQVIQTSGNADPGVNLFYQRDLPGVKRVLKPGHVHLHDDTSVDPNPENYVDRPTTLGELQDHYLETVVSATVQYQNVVYEIMNEPVHAHPPKPNAGAPPQNADAEAAVRATWANTVIDKIHNITQGQRLIFYNDHSGLDSWANRGKDIKYWAGLNHYHQLDGVTFHGDVQAVDPEKLGWSFRKDLIIQVSTDTNTGSGDNDSYDYNLTVTKNAVAHHLMFQAESISEEAAKGIGTALNLPAFIGKWSKLPDPRTHDNFPHLIHIQNPDGSVIDLNQDTDGIPYRGRVIEVTAQQITFKNDANQNTGTFFYDFPDPDPPKPPTGPPQIKLELTRDNNTQVFRRLNEHDLLYPFFFQWQRTSVTPSTSTIPPFFAFFYPDRTLITRTVNGLVVNNRAKITDITTTQIFIHSDTNNNDTIWAYSFTKGGQVLTLTKSDNTLSEEFQRVL